MNCPMCGELWNTVRCETCGWKEPVRHGLTCEKKPHHKRGGGYLHGEDDDSPYDVDHMIYCGRCHEAI